MTNQQQKRLKYAGITSTILVLVLVFQTPLKRQLHAWKLLPEPERLTELYFDKHTTLPATYRPGVTQHFSFTVHNLEYQTFTYSYQVIEQTEAGDHKAALSSGSFTLSQGEYRSVPINANLTDLGKRAKVVISLEPVNESIDYWVNKESQ